MKIILPLFILISSIKGLNAEPEDTLSLRINFILLQKSNGEGNFRLIDSLNMDYLNKSVEHLNNLYAFKRRAFPDTSCGRTHSYADSKIRFRLNKVIEIMNDSLWDNEQDKNWKNCPDRQRWYLLRLQKELDSTLNKENPGINIYLTVSATFYDYVINCEDTIEEKFPSHACSMYPSNNLNDFSVVHMPNTFLKYLFMQQFPYEWGWGTLGRGLAHELGHSLGLSHVYSCNNIMRGSGSTQRKSLDDRQVDKARNKILNTNLLKYLDP